MRDEKTNEPKVRAGHHVGSRWRSCPTLSTRRAACGASMTRRANGSSCPETGGKNTPPRDAENTTEGWPLRDGGAMNEPRVGSPRHEAAGTARVHRRESYLTRRRPGSSLRRNRHAGGMPVTERSD